MSAFDYDLFVIGAGSGGVRAARIAANHGARVAVAEEYRVGGTCVIRGCVPKKLMVYAGRFHGDFEDAAGFGWDVRSASFDWSILIANKDKEIDRLEKAYRANLERSKVTILPERATLLDAHTVKLASGKTIRADKILIATGAWPHLPDMTGAELGITSNEAFHLKKLPREIAIVGGGFIALEFAGIFNGLGSKVTVAYRGEQILRGFDDDLRNDLADAMRRRGVDIHTMCAPVAIEKAGDKLALTLTNGERVIVDHVMLATGRTPNTANLGLDKAGVKIGANGEIIVDAESRTNVANIYAVGDVTDRVALTPVAIREGHAFADSVFGGKPWTVGYDNIPMAVFSEPEVGSVGMSEADARRMYGDAVDIYKARFRPMKYTLSGRDERMMMKLVVNQKTQKLLGCHVLGPDAGEIVQMAAIAMQMGATKADFDRTMALHPSAAEELVTMRDKWVPPKAV